MVFNGQEDAFRIIPINPDDYHLGFSWNNECYYERVLQVRANSSCKFFEAFNTALQWIMINRYNEGGMSHILDESLSLVHQIRLPEELLFTLQYLLRGYKDVQLRR